MAINLTNQVNVLANCQAFRTLATNQLTLRNKYIKNMSREQLVALYKSGKDPVLNELYRLSRDMHNFFEGALDE